CCALAVWTLALIGDRRWPAAGVCAFVAGLVRPSAVALAVALAVGAAGAWRRGDAGRGRAVAACVLAPLGTAVSLVVVALHTGHLDAWSRAQAQGWQTGFDFALFFVHYLG